MVTFCLIVGIDLGFGFGNSCLDVAPVVAPTGEPSSEAIFMRLEGIPSLQFE
jgi:hypothetical protein